MTDLEINPVELSTPDDDLVHVVCCDNVDTSFCGLDMRGLQMVASTVPATCVVCEDMAKHLFCPLYRWCRVVTGA